MVAIIATVAIFAIFAIFALVIRVHVISRVCYTRIIPRVCVICVYTRTYCAHAHKTDICYMRVMWYAYNTHITRV